MNEAWLTHLRTQLWDLTHYLGANADSLPDYGARYRVDAPISTAFAESAVNEVLAVDLHLNRGNEVIDSKKDVQRIECMDACT